MSDRKEAGDETRTCIRLVLYRKEHVFIWFFLREILMAKEIKEVLGFFFLLNILCVVSLTRKTKPENYILIKDLTVIIF